MIRPGARERIHVGGGDLLQGRVAIAAGVVAEGGPVGLRCGESGERDDSKKKGNVSHQDHSNIDSARSPANRANPRHFGPGESCYILRMLDVFIQSAAPLVGAASRRYSAIWEHSGFSFSQSWIALRCQHLAALTS